jgi:hypothetical protein
VPWEEARELLVLVLLITVCAYVTGPLIRHLSVESQLDFWDDMRVILSNINVVSGLVLIGTALTVCTAPREATVPALRRSVSIIAKLVTAFGMVAMVNALTVRTAADSVLLRVSLVMTASGPGTLLAGLAAWLVDRVDMGAETLE